MSICSLQSQVVRSKHRADLKLTGINNTSEPSEGFCEGPVVGWGGGGETSGSWDAAFLMLFEGTVNNNCWKEKYSQIGGKRRRWSPSPPT